MKPGVVVLATGAMARSLLAMTGLTVSAVNVHVKAVELRAASSPVIVWLTGVPAPPTQLYVFDVYGPLAGVETVLPTFAVHLLAVKLGYVTDAGPEPLSARASTTWKLPAFPGSKYRVVPFQ